MKIGVDVITGFLGEGKSNFINDYIDYTKVEGERIYVIAYEKGNTKLNESHNSSYLVKVKYIDGEEVKLNDTIDEVIKSVKPHRIIIEYNGTMNLIELYKELSKKEARRWVKLFNIIFISSGKNLVSYIKNLGDFILPFVENSDVVIINNIKDINTHDLESVVNFIEKTNHKAHIFIEDTNEKILNSMNNKNLILNEKSREFIVKLINLSNK